MTQEKLVAMVRTASKEVFGTMLGIELEDCDAFEEVTAPGPSDGVLAFIGLAGQWAGSGTFSCPANIACGIAGALLMAEYPGVDDDVLDAIGEVTNMVHGNVKTALEEELGPMGLSIPTVIYGKNFTTRTGAKNRWTVVPFKCLGGEISIHICLAPSKDANVHQKAAKDQLSSLITLLS
jgi:chemotaxis protein CheX